MTNEIHRTRRNTVRPTACDPHNVAHLRRRQRNPLTERVDGGAQGSHQINRLGRFPRSRAYLEDRVIPLQNATEMATRTEMVIHPAVTDADDLEELYACSYDHEIFGGSPTKTDFKNVKVKVPKECKGKAWWIEGTPHSEDLSLIHI